MQHKAAIIVCDVFPPEVGGMASTASRLASYLTIEGKSPIVLVFKPGVIVQHMGGASLTFSTESILTRFDRHARFTSDWRVILPKDIKPSFVISLYMGRPAHIGNNLSWLLDIPHYIICLGSDLNDHFDRYSKKWRFEKLVGDAKRIGIISPDMGEKLLKFPGAKQKTVLVPPGFDHDNFHPAPVPEQYDFIFVGRARPVKGLDRFIRALSLIAKPARICLVIPQNTADTAFHETCRLFAARSCPQHAFEWLKDRSPRELQVLYNASRFVVVPSLNEGAPHVVLEAMACNRPVLAADVGRIAEFLGSRKMLFTTDEGFKHLLTEAVEGKLAAPANLRERALAIANRHDERAAFRRFVNLEEHTL